MHSNCIIYRYDFDEFCWKKVMRKECCFVSVSQVAESEQSTFTDLVKQLTFNCISDLQKARFDSLISLSSGG